MVEMTTPGRRIYNRTASAHMNVSSPTSPPPSTPPTPQTAKKPASPTPPTLVAPTAPVGAKKKKKKRSKGKSNAAGGAGVGSRGHGESSLGDEDLDYSRREGDDDDRDLTDDDIPDLVDIDRSSQLLSHSIPMTTNSSTSSKTPTTIGAGSKSKKKKKKTKAGSAITGVNGVEDRPMPRTGEKQKIWNTTTAEEKERIKEFWLGLSEQERRNLVRVEKEHVSKRVKEGSKILNCSCHVCGRKQVAIEEELDVLYDAYYEELENYSHPNAIQFGPEPPPDLYEDEEDDEEYDEEDDYDDSQDGDDYHQHHHPHHHHHHHGLPEDYIETRREIFNFGAHLMAKGGVLTIADDLLQNQGKQFIEMMEKIADMRFRKEEEAKREVQEAGGPYEEDYDDDQDDYYDEDEPEDSEEDEDPKVAEKRRMEEGRRMFHIFAARMFEQRVLAAYREKVARERQQKLLEEIEEEDRKAEEKNSKKAKEKERKKEKQRLQKQQREEERLKKEAEKAAEEAARREEEEKKLEEQRKKKEEARLKRETERKRQEMERLKKEEERRKRQAEERERQQEIERKRREKEEAAKKKRDEIARKEKEAKEREARERKEREERERKEKLLANAASTASAPPRRQSTPISPLRTPSQPVVPKIPTPNRTSVPPMTTTPPHHPVNGSSSTTPLTAHTPSPHTSANLVPQLQPHPVGQPFQQSAYFHSPVQASPTTGFPSPSLRSQFSENAPPTVQHVLGPTPMQPGRQPTGVPPIVNGLPLGIYAPLPIGNPSQFGRYAPTTNQPAANHPVIPLGLARGFADTVPPPTPTFPTPIGSIPSHGSPILPPPKPVDSGLTSPQISHSRKASIDALPDLPGSLGPRHVSAINGSGIPPNPPGLSRTIQRPTPIQRPQSTTSSGRGGFLQDEEMGVGSRALLDDEVEDLVDDEIIEPTPGSAPGFGQSRRTNAFPSLGDKIWAAPPSSSSSDTMWGQPDKNASFPWGSITPSSTDEHSFQNWDSRPAFSPSMLTTLQERIRETLVRTDPQGFHAVDSVVNQLQRQYPMDRVTADDVISAAQASPTSFLVMFKNGVWIVRSVNPSDTRAVVGARMMTALGPKPGTPPNDLGRNMLGSLAEVVRGLD